MNAPIKVELMHRHGTFFIHDCTTGHTRPASRQVIVDLYGESVADVVAETPGWICFDSEEDARAAMELEVATQLASAAIQMVTDMDLPPAA
ncbi:MAG TPA: hypothetical protein VF669_13210 [Tepidisphaeraceae bacterium]|jgi:hypothetical protein